MVCVCEFGQLPAMSVEVEVGYSRGPISKQWFMLPSGFARPWPVARPDDTHPRVYPCPSSSPSLPLSMWVLGCSPPRKLKTHFWRRDLHARDCCQPLSDVYVRWTLKRIRGFEGSWLCVGLDRLFPSPSLQLDKAGCLCMMRTRLWLAG